MQKINMHFFMIVLPFTRGETVSQDLGLLTFWVGKYYREITTPINFGGLCNLALKRKVKSNPEFY